MKNRCIVLAKLELCIVLHRIEHGVYKGTRNQRILVSLIKFSPNRAKIMMCLTVYICLFDKTYKGA